MIHNETPLEQLFYDMFCEIKNDICGEDPAGGGA